MTVQYYHTRSSYSSVNTIVIFCFLFYFLNVHGLRVCARVRACVRVIIFIFFSRQHRKYQRKQFHWLNQKLLGNSQQTVTPTKLF